MKPGATKLWAKVGIIFSVAGGVYCFLGVAMAVWLSATPNFPPARTERNLLIWGAGALSSAAIFVVSLFALLRNSRR